MSRIVRYPLLSIFCFLLLATVILHGSYDARDWIHIHIFPSTVENQQPLPPVAVPPKNAGLRYLQFIAVGDIGTGGYGQRMVAKAMDLKAAKDSISLVLLLGDNIYESGVTSVTDPQWKSKFEDVYVSPSLHVPFYAVLGNHDYRLNPQAEVEYTARSTRWRMPERYYTFTHVIDDSTSAQFFCLDTQPMAYLEEDDLTSGNDSGAYMPQIRWLERGLSRSRAHWKFVLGHHPLYSNGDHNDNKNLTALLEPLFADYRVDFYLSGHDHDLQLLKPVKGVNYIVSGAGGKHRDTIWGDNTLYAGTNLGFAFFRISHKEAILEFVDRDGITRYAHRFTKDSIR